MRILVSKPAGHGSRVRAPDRDDSLARHNGCTEVGDVCKSLVSGQPSKVGVGPIFSGLGFAVVSVFKGYDSGLDVFG